MNIEKAEFRFNDVFEISFNLKKYKKEIGEVVIKYLKGELTAEKDEEGAKGFFDLAIKIIDDNCSLIWKSIISYEIHHFLYKKLKEYAPAVTREALSS